MNPLGGPPEVIPPAIEPLGDPLRAASTDAGGGGIGCTETLPKADIAFGGRFASKSVLACLYNKE
jgi:hypothetical protein